MVNISACGLIVGITVTKHKPMYRVSISGTELGYVQNKEAFEEKVKIGILEEEEKNIDSIDMKIEPEYTLEFVDKTIETKEEDIAETIKQDVTITYKYYELAFIETYVLRR